MGVCLHCFDTSQLYACPTMSQMYQASGNKIKKTNKYSIRILEDLLSRQQSSMLLEVAAYGKA